MSNSKITIVYANVGIDTWSVSIDPRSTDPYDMMLGQMKYKTKFHHHSLQTAASRRGSYFDSFNVHRGTRTPIYDKVFNKYYNNGCLLKFPAFKTVFDKHLSDVKDVVNKNMPDILLLNEMCDDSRLADFTSLASSIHKRIKTKDDAILEGNPDWKPKIEAIIVNQSTKFSDAKIQHLDRKGSLHNYNLPLLQTTPTTPTTPTTSTTTIDEREVISYATKLGTYLTKADALTALEPDYYCYNANISKYTLANGESLLIWFVHWAVLLDPVYANEITIIITNIITYLTNDPKCNFIAIGDFNTNNTTHNSPIFSTFVAQLNTLQHLRNTEVAPVYHKLYDNDGAIAYYNKDTFSDIKIVGVDNQRDFSAHSIITLELVFNVKTHTHVASLVYTALAAAGESLKAVRESQEAYVLSIDENNDDKNAKNGCKEEYEDIIKNHDKIISQAKGTLKTLLRTKRNLEKAEDYKQSAEYAKQAYIQKCILYNIKDACTQTRLNIEKAIKAFIDVYVPNTTSNNKLMNDCINTAYKSKQTLVALGQKITDLSNCDVAEVSSKLKQKLYVGELQTVINDLESILKHLQSCLNIYLAHYSLPPMP